MEEETNLIRFLTRIVIGILLIFYGIVTDFKGVFYALSAVVSIVSYCFFSNNMWSLFLAYIISTFISDESPLIALILQLAAVMVLLGISLIQFKTVSANCTEDHCKKVREKYLTEMSVINLGVIATINYLKGPWWASLLSNVVTIIYYFYISDGPKLVSARFRRSPRNLQDNEEQEELFGINADI